MTEGWLRNVMPRNVMPFLASHAAARRRPTAMLFAGPALALVFVAGTLAACDSLPGSGPSTSDVTAAAAKPMASGEKRFALVDVDPNVVAKLESWTAVSLQGTFGQRERAFTQAIGPGDSVQVAIWEAGPGLFSPPVATADRAGSGSRAATIPEQVVGNGQQGAITVPFAGRIPVVGQTPQQVEQAIIRALAQRAVDPQVVVTVTKNVSNTVSVVGEVTGGARVPLTGAGERVLDVVAQAGGTKAPAHETFITLMRKDSVVRIPMQAMLANPAENVPVQSGDVITVAREPQTFTAAGATGQNAVVPFDAIGITLDQAIARAGGLSDMRADPAGVFVIRYERPADYDQLGLRRPDPGTLTQIPVIYRVNMRDPNGFFLARRFPVRNKDIVYVSNAPLTDVQKVMSMLLPILGVGATAAVVANTTR